MLGVMPGRQYEPKLTNVEWANFARDNCEAIIGTKIFPVNNNEDKGYE